MKWWLQTPTQKKKKKKQKKKEKKKIWRRKGVLLAVLCSMGCMLRESERIASLLKPAPVQIWNWARLGGCADAEPALPEIVWCLSQSLLGFAFCPVVAFCLCFFFVFCLFCLPFFFLRPFLFFSQSRHMVVVLVDRRLHTHCPGWLAVGCRQCRFVWVSAVEQPPTSDPLDVDSGRACGW
jgi:hypothetical protein